MTTRHPRPGSGGGGGDKVGLGGTSPGSPLYIAINCSKPLKVDMCEKVNSSGSVTPVGGGGYYSLP